jgi:hypothetical protein
VKHPLLDRYRCTLDGFPCAHGTLDNPDFFTFGSDVLCYGRLTSRLASRASRVVPDVLEDVVANRGDIELPFDLSEVVANLTHERYPVNGAALASAGGPNGALKKLYYALRPMLPTPLRAPIQRTYLRRRRRAAFPAWPTDVTVDKLLGAVLVQYMKARGINRIPFIWFWPDGFSSAAILTHDVETEKGRSFCSELMTLNEAYGFRSAFQIVPEKRYRVESSLLDEIRLRGHELNVHDLNHDGRLFGDRDVFTKRVKKINEYGRTWGAKGFRSAILYRNPDWYDALEFQYDMSIPNSARLDPQPGGCCTVFPYFIGNTLELPVTMAQDYSLFYILREERIDLWKNQVAAITGRHGLLSFITHPDYIREDKTRARYEELLQFLSAARSPLAIWCALPAEVDTWWRRRSRMHLVETPKGHQIEGPGCERARVAYATLQGDKLVYTLADSDTPRSCPAMKTSRWVTESLQ